MSKLISIKHPYELDHIKKPSDFIIFTKNMLRSISKKGCFEKKDGILIPLRWSIKQNKFVIDRGTKLQRDKIGVSLDNIDYYYKKNELIYDAVKYTLKVAENKDFFDFCKKYKIIPNENKFIAFEYVNGKTNKVTYEKETIYPHGIFKFDKSNFTRKNSHLLDNFDETLKELSEINGITFNERLFIKNYQDVNSRFISQLKNKKSEYLKDNSNKIVLDYKKILTENREFNKHNLLKDYKQIIKSNKLSNRYDMSFIIMLELNISIGIYLMNELGIHDSEGIVFWDEISNDFVKLTGNFILNTMSFTKKESEEELKAPLLPMVF